MSLLLKDNGSPPCTQIGLCPVMLYIARTGGGLNMHSGFPPQSHRAREHLLRDLAPDYPDTIFGK